MTVIRRISRWRSRYWRRRKQGFTVPEACALASGRPCEREQVWEVPFWLLGRHIATVRIPAASEAGAIEFASSYLKANIYPHKYGKSAGPLPGGGMELMLAPLPAAKIPEGR